MLHTIKWLKRGKMEFGLIIVLLLRIFLIIGAILGGVIWIERRFDKKIDRKIKTQIEDRLSNQINGEETDLKGEIGKSEKRMIDRMDKLFKTYFSKSKDEN